MFMGQSRPHQGGQEAQSALCPRGYHCTVGDGCRRPPASPWLHVPTFPVFLISPSVLPRGRLLYPAHKYCVPHSSVLSSCLFPQTFPGPAPAGAQFQVLQTSHISNSRPTYLAVSWTSLSVPPAGPRHGGAKHLPPTAALWQLLWPPRSCSFSYVGAQGLS